MNRYTLGALVCLLLSAPLAWHLVQRRSADRQPVLRVATFNVALNRGAPGALLAELRGGACVQARQLAEIVQRTAPDVLLLNELDGGAGSDLAGEAAAVFAREYLAVAQGGLRGIEYPFKLVMQTNTGEPSGRDLDLDGNPGGPGDAFGFGVFPGQYGMVLLSRHPILVDQVRTFRQLRWSSMPGALRPEGFWDDTVWGSLRLSSKNHVDVPIGPIGTEKQVVHMLCSHPTPPVFDGPEDRNGRRNHDEIRFWLDYLTPERAQWIVDDAGVTGGLSAAAPGAPEAPVPFVLLGDLNCDPVDGDARREALLALLAHPRVQDPQPRSAGGKEEAQRQFGKNAQHVGDPRLDTGDFPDPVPAGPGNLRVDYVLPARELRVAGSGVFWPPQHEPTSKLVAASDHRLVWVDLALR